MKLFYIGKIATIVDDDIYDRMQLHNWSLTPDGYIRTTIGRRTVKLHRFIMGNEGQDIDHIDRNRLNNLRINLRFATRSQNTINSPKDRGAISSRYKGVNYSKLRGYFIARITKDGKTVMVYKSASEEACAYAYNIAVDYLYGEFACFNDVNLPENFMNIKQHVIATIKYSYGK